MLGRVSWCQVMGGLYIASPHTLPLILHWSVFYWWVPLIPIWLLPILYFTIYSTTDNADIYFTPEKNNKVDHTFLVCSTGWPEYHTWYCLLLQMAACKEYSATICENSIFVKTGFISAIKLSTEIKQL